MPGSPVADTTSEKHLEYDHDFRRPSTTDVALLKSRRRRRTSGSAVQTRTSTIQSPRSADICIQFLDDGDSDSDNDNENNEGESRGSGDGEDAADLGRDAKNNGTGTGRSWFKDRFLRRGKRQIGVPESLKAIVLSSWLNLFLIFIPLSWWAHYGKVKHDEEDGADKQQRVFDSMLTFYLSLLALIPLEKFLDYGGEQMKIYCGRFFGDSLIVSLNNAVEGSLALILLSNCELRLLQATVIGVSLLHLLLVPGVSFMVGGARLLHQDLNPHITQLNHTLLLMGVLTVLLPAAYFNTLERGVSDSTIESNSGEIYGKILQFSRGLAVILLTVYLLTRFFMFNPPGKDNAFRALPDAPDALLKEEQEVLEKEPEVNQWVCIVTLIAAIVVMEQTASYLVDSVEIVREEAQISEEWFGLILLPLTSFSADALLAMGYFVKYVYMTIRGKSDTEVPTLAKARSIDISIQFTLLWMPLLVLIGWGQNTPMSLLFDAYEVLLILGACLLVNYITADAKTNWAEGFAMIAFYVMIALVSWFYEGETIIAEFLQTGSCASVSQE